MLCNKCSKPLYREETAKIKEIRFWVEPALYDDFHRILKKGKRSEELRALLRGYLSVKSKND
jgi:predicted component of type VI protein secretion system